MVDNKITTVQIVMPILKILNTQTWYEPHLMLYHIVSLRLSRTAWLPVHSLYAILYSNKNTTNC
jgi:hypothetical protein